MTRSKLFLLVLRLGIAHIFFASTISPAAEVLAAPIKTEANFSCLPGTSCFFKFSCGDDEEEIDGTEKAVPSSSGACEHKIKNVSPTVAIPAGMNAPKISSSVPSPNGGSPAVPPSSAPSKNEGQGVVKNPKTISDKFRLLNPFAKAPKDPKVKSNKPTLGTLQKKARELEEEVDELYSHAKIAGLLNKDKKPKPKSALKTAQRFCSIFPKDIDRLWRRGRDLEYYAISLPPTKQKERAKERVHLSLLKLEEIYPRCRAYYPNLYPMDLGHES
ncbi:hypothetical protein F5878DRAFT_289132 [Lentinula raphanica]|uniref:Uncharacterized protein n=1 Tax=Lentinula raphanica TaxID=153919 RepID=A0AA38P4A4_9AGAR|nr:hypothetical protein F5878DRAFT_289132 [Lentinula raphanica]